MIKCVKELVAELEAMEPVYNDELAEDDDYDDYMTDAWDVLDSIINRLPNVWNNDFDTSGVEIATNGYELLFKYECDCERIADLLDEKVFCCPETHTGYYNPEEDERSGETDANTGWYYIDWD